VADFGLSFIQETDEAPETVSSASPNPYAVGSKIVLALNRFAEEALKDEKVSDTAHSISTLVATIRSTASCSGGGTHRWMAPERIIPTDTAKATPASDVYSFAMLIVEVC
jgi:serine/threonine protein kinase